MTTEAPLARGVARALATTVLVGLLAGCHHDSAPANLTGSANLGAPSASVEAPPLDAGSTDGGVAGPVIHVEDDGKAFDVAVGTPLTFELARHAGTGFEWIPGPLDGGVLAPRGERRSVRTSDIPGAPKLDVYEMVAQATGTVTVEMRLRRPWNDQPPVKSLRVTIRVH